MKRKNLRFLSAIAAFALVAATGVNAQTDYASKVDTKIGSEGFGWAAGYIYPGATYPFGMVQFTPTYFQKQLGFVINQISGAGCDHMGNLPTFPLNGALEVSPNDMVSLRVRIDDEVGTAGHYQARVDGDIKTELSVTERTGMARFEYAPGQSKGTIIIGGGIAANPIDQSAISITSPNSCEGYAIGGKFCGVPTPYKVYFVAEFDNEAVEFGTWKDKDLFAGSSFSEGKNSGVYFTFDVNSNKAVNYKIGVSYVSVENARQNLLAENPRWDFKSVKDAAVAEWNKYLGMIEVEGTNPDRAKQFYTHLYHFFIHPNVCSDVNGEYMGSDWKVHKSRSKQYTSLSNWDTYRTQIQLLSMLAPDIASDVVQSHYDFAKQDGGGYPRWVMANVETGIMEGDPTPILIAGAYAFGARNYDVRDVVNVMMRNGNEEGLMSQNFEVRPGLRQYKQKGYWRGSLTLEYAAADFAIARLAHMASNDLPRAQGFYRNAGNWKNIYNPETGWMHARNEDGSWRGLDEVGVFGGGDWRESTPKNYFWMVQHDLGGLIELMGGKKKAEARLDTLFRAYDASYANDWFAAGNEPSFGIPWVYNWVNRPDKASNAVRRTITEMYSSALDGMPGNDDLGTMGAWYVFACIGLYPEIPSVGGFSINSPIFNKITMHLPGGDVVIKGGSEKDVYIQSMKLNGKPYESTWLDWDAISGGATIEYKLGSRPSKWGTQIDPPSFPEDMYR